MMTFVAQAGTEQQAAMKSPITLIFSRYPGLVVRVNACSFYFYWYFGAAL